LIARFDRDLATQLVERETLQERLARLAAAIDQNRGIALDQKEIEQNLALRRQQRGIEALAGLQLLDVVGDEALQK